MQQAREVNDAANSSSGHAPRMPAVDVSLAFEVSGFVVELVAKRPRIEPERLDSRPEDAGTAAAVNRDYDAEWRCERITACRRRRVAIQIIGVRRGAGGSFF